jgi:hypothetical protein
MLEKANENTASGDWRPLMSREELAAFDAGEYDNVETAPRESDWVSRNKREVSYKAEYVQHQPGSQNDDGTFRHSVPGDQAEQEVNGELRTPLTEPTGDPELAEYHKKCIEAVEGFSQTPANCLICGTYLRGDASEKRATVLLHSDKDNAAVYCWSCFHEKNTLPLNAADDWQSKLTPLHLKVFERYRAGKRQQEIAAALTNGSQRVSQSKVSRLLDDVKKARTSGRKDL